MPFKHLISALFQMQLLYFLLLYTRMTAAATRYFSNERSHTLPPRQVQHVFQNLVIL